MPIKHLGFPDSPFQVIFSFEDVIENLERDALDSDAYVADAAKGILEEISSFPELKTGITDFGVFETLKEPINKLLAPYFPKALTLNEIKAVSIPYMDIIINPTQRFTNILEAAGPELDFNIRDLDDHQFYVLSSCLVLNEFYGAKINFSKPLLYDIPDAEGISRHYRILYNADFLDILKTEKSLPLTPEDVDLLLDNYEDLELWKSKIPPESYILKGFAIVTLYDATIDNAVSMLKEKLLSVNTPMFQQSVASIFRTIYRIPDLQVGFTLFIPEEKRFKVAAFGQAMKSYILGQQHTPDSMPLCTYSYQTLVKDRNYFAISNLEQFYAANPNSHLAKTFSAAEIGSFILAPVVKNGKLMGILEIVSPRKKELNSVNAHRLEVVMPFLTESIERLVAEYQNQVSAIIQSNYTTIHPSVNWKFRTEAQHYLEAKNTKTPYVLKEVSFDHVHPLYGQMDIKGSSDSRNESVRKDLQNQLHALLGVFDDLSNLKNLEQERLQVNSFLKELGLTIQANTEQYITNYLDGSIHAWLRQQKSTTILTAYLLDLDEQRGRFFTYRRKYEKTISLINDELAHVIDVSQEDAQAIFPHYYERFKSDGIDFNLYVGQEISPNQQYTSEKLSALKCWQLEVLCLMEMAHQRLKPQLPYQLDVTTLILIYHSTIAIRFRMDEKRFDIDGTYNARFEIVKKRIDKAHIKNTNERITEAGKMTIVYSSEVEEMEYLGYLATLQQRNLLDTEIEHFDVEDLQGISGLKAIRVRYVKLPDLTNA
ncbi:GAF domain-containing protein [Pedobacter duraquae]|nr:GAF domain-containing protein [Pedobacter duraquae]